MSVPRGKPRELILALNEIQDLVGRAIAVANNDRDGNQMEKLNKALTEAFNKCVEARSLYDPINRHEAANG